MSSFFHCARSTALPLLLGLLLGAPAVADTTAPSKTAPEAPPSLEQMRAWVEQMKTASRGPFERIRWFCDDGTVLPPGPGACREHDGGVQHGEWNARTLAIRAAGYPVATLLADIKTLDFVGPDAHLDELRQILLEQFLIQNDDGWVFRAARYYRGALQVEDERAGARSLLLALVDEADWRTPERFLLLREATRLLPVNSEPPTAAQARQLAIEIAERDPAFNVLRIKIHGLPDATDPQRVREYAATHGVPELAARYQDLAAVLDTLYAPRAAIGQLEQLIGESGSRALKATLRDAIAQLQAAPTLAARLRIAGEFGLRWRASMMQSSPSIAQLSPPNRVRLLQASLAMEQEIYATGNQLLEHTEHTSRLTRLHWLRSLGMSLAAAGFLSERQWQALDQRLVVLEQSQQIGAEDYYAALRYLARVPQWAQRAQEFQFGTSIEHWSDLTDRAVHFIPDRLRGSPLLAYTRVLDALLQDAQQHVGVEQTLFDAQVSGGLRALNPGLRRGVLLPAPSHGENFRSDGIYLLPSTTPELPPVAGILTRGEGSSLSHVQLLARNLGIPNVVIDAALIDRLTPHFGARIVLAVSPRGTVRISADGPHWDAIFGRETLAEDAVIQPDLGKLDVQQTALVPLRDIRAEDSGRTVGPKAANLGELAQHYPEAVNPGVVIPFGVFRALLDQPIAHNGPSTFEWLRAEYARLRVLTDPAVREKETRLMLERLRHWIANTTPGDGFRARLRAAMQEAFGATENVGVFVRSDTNVEDLPGFSGAGLNLTLPNVVGFDAVVRAIQKVWASPFTERAFAWRQAHMEQPEHVYPAVLLLKTFASEKSGVLVTADIENGDRHWLSIAVSEGVGGAVEGQAAEELRVRRDTGETRLLAQASAPLRAEPLPTGGVSKRPASGRDTVLLPAEIERLRLLADDVEHRFPMPEIDAGLRAPADIEFGFRRGQLALFQIRPFVESTRARRSQYLIDMDRGGDSGGAAMIDLRAAPMN
ncbi:MAG: phosphoenolpyruvate synthase [Gammaproteobacteria bacterium]|nr:phosphoenolpyruvate synthase [Gammaproteobacteria bacterium]